MPTEALRALRRRQGLGDLAKRRRRRRGLHRYIGCTRAVRRGHVATRGGFEAISPLLPEVLGCLLSRGPAKSRVLLRVTRVVEALGGTILGDARRATRHITIVPSPPQCEHFKPAPSDTSRLKPQLPRPPLHFRVTARAWTGMTVAPHSPSPPLFLLPAAGRRPQPALSPRKPPRCRSGPSCTWRGSAS